MPVSSPVSIIAACAALLVTPYAEAADLAARSPIGAIFADESPGIVLQAPPVRSRIKDNIFWAGAVYSFQQRIPGYYGRPGDFYYRSYYGTPPEQIFGRDPYACTILGWC
jgi:hypothetical protein